jgi:hypothetical protein
VAAGRDGETAFTLHLPVPFRAMRIFRSSPLALCAVGAVLISGCGGSSNGDRTKALNKIQSQLNSSSTFNDADLSSCMMGQFKTLSTSELQKIANAGNNPDAATKSKAINVASTCVAQGHGATALHAAIVQGINGSSSSSSLPPEVKTCITDKANQLPNAQLAQLVALAAQGENAVTNRGKQIGAGLAIQCLSEPKLQGIARDRFLAPIKTGLATSKFSSVFKDCVLKKAEAVPTSQILALAADPSTAQSKGQTLGRGFAQQCIASGARP